MKKIEVKAKTIIEAIEEACRQLGVEQEDLDIEILSQGGMFGKAKIAASVKEGSVKAEPKVEIKAEKPEVKDDKKADKADKKQEKTEKKEEKKVNAAPVKPAQAMVVRESGEIVSGAKFEKTTEFVKKLLVVLENDSTVTTEHTDTAFNISVTGEHIGQLIGKGGAVLNAIQTIVSSIAITNSNGEGKRVFVNIGDYKEKRGDTLQSLAQKKAEYVKRTGRFVKLEPMNARDRAIIHTALQGVEGIKTYSTGRDPFRCLCIAPADSSDKSDKSDKE